MPETARCFVDMAPVPKNAARDPECMNTSVAVQAPVEQWDHNDVQAWAKRVAGLPKPCRMALKAVTGKVLMGFTSEVGLGKSNLLSGLHCCQKRLFHAGFGCDV